MPADAKFGPTFGENRRLSPAAEPATPCVDDPAFSEALRLILGSASYREADEDIDFLKEPDSRGLRLQIEYLKADTLLREHGVAHAIVVFGSTRIEEPQVAERRLREAVLALERSPADREMQQLHARARRLADTSRYYETARELGRIVGREGARSVGGRTTIMTGGGPGIMEAANRGAREVGAPSVGLNISLPHEQLPNPYITPELCLRFRYFALRKLHFAMRARALVVFPGGYGTLDELFEILELTQTRKMPQVPVILVGEAHWRRVFDPQFLVDEGMIDPADRRLFWFVETAEQIWTDILGWYAERGQPLIEADTPAT